ncbi:MAG: polymer-forming cytoskeletal protein [Motiliproteus sp.]
MNIVGKMHIDGIFEGTVASLDSISIGQRGEVHGNIRAHQISICGLLQGEVHCDELIIEDGGRVRGVVYCEQMVVHKKGCFIGERHLKELGASSEPDLLPSESSRSNQLARTLEELPDRITLAEDTAPDAGPTVKKD